MQFLSECKRITINFKMFKPVPIVCQKTEYKGSSTNRLLAPDQNF